MVSAVRQMAKSKKEYRHLNTHWQAVAYISSGGLFLYLLFSFRINISKFRSLCIFTKNKECVCFPEPWTNWSAVQQGESWEGWLKSRGTFRLLDMQMGCVECTVPWLYCVAGHRVAVSLSTGSDASQPAVCYWWSRDIQGFSPRSNGASAVVALSVLCKHPSCPRFLKEKQGMGELYPPGILHLCRSPQRLLNLTILGARKYNVTEKASRTQI